MSLYQDYIATVVGAMSVSIVFSSFASGAIADLNFLNTNMVNKVSPKTRIESLRHVDTKLKYKPVSSLYFSDSQESRCGKIIHDCK